MRATLHRRTRGVLLVVSAALSLSGCLAQRSVVTTPGEVSADFAVAIARGRNIVRPLAQRGSGVAVAVGVDGKLVWSEGFGHGSRDGGAPVQPDSRFRVYSLMKQVTAVMALQSASRREVDLRASVRRVIPDLPEHYLPVTALQLLTHTSGVRHYRDSAEARLTVACATAAEALPHFVADPLAGTPGTVERYSTWGFVLLSAVLERAAGLPFDSVLAARIAGPSAMTTIRLEGKDDPGTRVRYYDVDGKGNTRETPRLDNSCKMGGGGFVSSAEDLVRFHNAVLRGELVPLPAVRQMLGARTSLLAGGSGPGAEAVSQVDLATRISVVILSNTGGLEQRLALHRARDLLAAVFAPEPRDRAAWQPR
jgi:CubicO group peptidase (beta-lactamase class C family)